MTGYVTTIFHQHFEKTIQEGVVSKFEDITISPDGNYALLLHQDGIIKMMISSGVVNDIQRLRLSNDQHSSFNGIDISPDASYALVTDDVNHRIKKIFLINGEVVSVVTLPTANRGQDFLPNKIAISPSGNYALITETGHHWISLMNLSNGLITIIAGQSEAGYFDDVGTNAKFNSPTGLDIAPCGNYALIADSMNVKIRKISLHSSMVTTFGTTTPYQSVYDLSISSTGLYALICGDLQIYSIDMNSEIVTKYAGDKAGFANGYGTNAQFRQLNGIAISPDETMSLVADIKIRQMTLPAASPTMPTSHPTLRPSPRPSPDPTHHPTLYPTYPTSLPTGMPTQPSGIPTGMPTNPTGLPTSFPTHPTCVPTYPLTRYPTLSKHLLHADSYSGSIGAMIGSIVGGVVGLCVLIALIVFCIKKFRNQSSESPQPKDTYGQVEIKETNNNNNSKNNQEIEVAETTNHL